MRLVRITYTIFLYMHSENQHYIVLQVSIKWQTVWQMLRHILWIYEYNYFPHKRTLWHSYAFPNAYLEQHEVRFTNIRTICFPTGKIKRIKINENVYCLESFRMEPHHQWHPFWRSWSEQENNKLIVVVVSLIFFFLNIYIKSRKCLITGVLRS